MQKLIPNWTFKLADLVDFKRALVDSCSNSQVAGEAPWCNFSYD
ncbi:MAG: hypothetical protein ABJM43_21965 [Paracoccaceae bacterium]